MHLGIRTAATVMDGAALLTLAVGCSGSDSGSWETSTTPSTSSSASVTV